jgi:hypothetical protein
MSWLWQRLLGRTQTSLAGQALPTDRKSFSKKVVTNLNPGATK